MRIITPFLIIIMSCVVFSSDSFRRLYDVPKLASIVIDGRDNDWARQPALEIDSFCALSGARKNPDDFSVKARIGWDDKGLLVLLYVKDNIFKESPVDSQLFIMDAVEFFLRPMLGSPELVHWVVAPGMEGKLVPRSKLYDSRGKELRSREAKLVMARQRQKKGYILEAQLAWEALDIKPEIGRHIAFQIIADDADKPKDTLSRLAWFRGIESGRDPFEIQCLRLAKKPYAGLPFMISVDHSNDWTDQTFEIAADSSLSSQTVVLKSEGKPLAAGLLARDTSGYATAHLAAELTAPNDTPAMLIVDLYADTMDLCKLMLQVQPAVLSTESKLWGLANFWKEVDYNFPDPERLAALDWSAAFAKFIPKIMQASSTVGYYRVMAELAALLKDPQTTVIPPAFVQDYYDRPPVNCIDIGKKFYIVNASLSLRDSLPIGAEVTAVNGMAIKDYLQSRVFPYLGAVDEEHLWNAAAGQFLAGEKNTEITITIKTGKEKGRTVRLARNRNSLNEPMVRNDSLETSPFVFRMLGDSIAGIRINTFDTRAVPDGFAACTTAIKNSRAVVFDIRNNSGGSDENWLPIVSFFIDTAKAKAKDTSIVFSRGRVNRSANRASASLAALASAEQMKEHPEIMEQILANQIYLEGRAFDTVRVTLPRHNLRFSKPVVMLTGPATGSSAESFIHSWMLTGGAMLVGQKTCGAYSIPLRMKLPAGGVASVAADYRISPNGKEWIGGIDPDVKIDPTAQDYFAGKDLVLDKAIEVIRQKLSAKSKK